MNSAHIGEKVHPCRYVGCSYSGVQSGNRNKHEKRIHGQIYTEAVAKGLMPPLEKKKKIPFPKLPPDPIPEVQGQSS